MKSANANNSVILNFHNNDNEQLSRNYMMLILRQNEFVPRLTTLDKKEARTAFRFKYKSERTMNNV